jgi:hypothetical protein
LRKPAVPVRFAKVKVRPAPAPLRLRLILGNGRRAELEVVDPRQLTQIVAALECAV